MMTPPKKKTTPDRPCDCPGCHEAGTHRAPKDRRLKEHYWFCLKHVAEYNKSWDFLQGLSPDEIELHLQHDTTWQRPTWKLGGGAPAGARPHPRVRDFFGIYEELGLGMDGQYNPPAHQPAVEKRLIQAMRVMELQFPLDKSLVKKQYKKMAKLCHPDKNPKDSEAGARFQKLSEAYHYILERLGG